MPAALILITLFAIIFFLSDCKTIYQPALLKNKSGNDVLVNQVGWAGIVPGRLDFDFSKIKNKNSAKFHTVVVGKKTRE